MLNQANIAHGPQQVNNAVAHVWAATPAPDHEKLQNELLTVKHGKTLDTFRTSTASGIDPGMETVETINRSSNGRGKSASESECVQGRDEGATS